VSTYSERWRRVFGRDPDRTRRDVEFLVRTLPLPEFKRILDVPCGDGRLVRALGALGYDVMGVDGDAAVAPAVVADLRELDRLSGGFDGVINMWASFGYFGSAENERVLASLGRRLRPGGRLVLDVFNRAFFEAVPAETVREVRHGIVERATFGDGRRRCELDYGDGQVEVFEWQLYLPEELEELGRRYGLAPLLREAAPDEPSMRLVFEQL
jgi:SAM-dependent methyltransferase